MSQFFKPLFLIALLCSLELRAQPTSDPEFQASACLNELIDLTNNSTPDLHYAWDFCTDDINQEPTITSANVIPGFALSHGMDIVFDGSWYGFVSDQTNNKIFRLDYGDDPSLSPISITDLGNPNDLLHMPEGIDFIRVSDSWHAFVAYGDNGGYMVRLDFENGLDSPPTNSENIGNFGLTGRVRDIRVVEDGGIYYLVFAYYNQNQLGVVNLTSDITYIPDSDDATLTNISGSSLPRGFELVKKDNLWYAFFANEVNDDLQQLYIGNHITNPPVIERTLSSVLTNAIRMSIVPSGEDYFAIVSNRFGQPTVINLHDLDPASGFEILSNAGMANLVGLKAIKVNGRILVHAFAGSTQYQITYEETCSASITADSSFEPENLQFTESGSYSIELITRDESDLSSVVSEPITILNQSAPVISFTTDNACVSFEGTFDASTSDLTYTWDFGDGTGTQTGQSTTHDYLSSGTYTVRLDVDDGTCGNFTEQEITIYEEPPMPSFEVVGNLCADGEITFNNLTLDGSYSGPLTYEWDFNGQDVAGTRDASFVFGSAGMKTVTLTSSIPGCENSMEMIINLQPGPTSLFTAPSVCQNDLLTFTNQSTDADSYEWDFGDGFTTTQANASHVYTESGIFNVRLEAFDLDGCSAIFEEEVSVSPEPIANFSYDIACTGNQGVEFTDQSTVESADIVDWAWRVNDQLMSTEQSPTLSFDETGLVDVSLTVTSSNGCVISYEESINILSDPEPNFVADVSCQTLISTFTDTSIDPENIVNRVWEIEGQIYTQAEVQHVFSASGQIDVSLTVTGQNFCSSTLYSSVNIVPALGMNFAISSFCDNEELFFEDTSTSSESIVSREWSLNGTPFFNGSTALISQLEAGSYTVGLTSQTESGCEFTLEQDIVINEAPVASFTSPSYGIPPFTLSLSNQSSGATNFNWLVNGIEISSSENTSYSITEEGDYQIELVASNSSGCSDNMILTVISRQPAINLIASGLTLVPSGNSQTISLQITNNGNLPIEIFDVIVSSSSSFSFSERINEFIDIGSQINVQLASAIQTSSSQRICVEIESAYDDISPDNNQACINFTPKVVFEDIYPNPFQDEAVVRFILPEASNVRLFISNSTGKLIDDNSYNLEEGLQIFRFNSSQWEKGLYFVNVLYDGTISTQRVLKF